jgi:hypothetical protein
MAKDFIPQTQEQRAQEAIAYRANVQAARAQRELCQTVKFIKVEKTIAERFMSIISK